MPTAFETQFSQRAAPRLLDEFGLSVTYTPVSGTPRTITVLLDNFTPTSLSDVPGMIGGKFIVSALNDNTDGILVSSADTDGDTIAINGTTYRLLQIITTDDGGGLVDWEVG